jgi:hypothetical protein
MATKTVRVSDLSGQQIPDDDQGARLIVEHPDYQEPIGLDVVPDEVQQHLSDENSRFVVVSLQTADAPNPQRYILSFEEFDRLFQGGDAQRVLEEAYSTQQQDREAQSGRRGRGRRAVASGTRERIDYTSSEHAGMPHRGTISEAEKEYVRNHLDEVNRRREEQGHAPIDPADPRDAAKYSFEPPVNGGPADADTSSEGREPKT